MQGEEQVRAQSVRRRIRRRGTVLDGGMRMPALPVAQMPGASQTDLARMAMLAVELACKADARLVLKRLDNMGCQPSSSASRMDRASSVEMPF